MRFSGLESSSKPFKWPISTFRVDPQNAQIFEPGGGVAWAR
jgi:hypothetical protein